MFSVASDYTALIGFLVGAVVVSTYFEKKKHPCPENISKSLANLWTKLWERGSGHIPDSKRIREHFEGGDWGERSQHRIQDAMLVMIVYGAITLFYCGNCYRGCCGMVVYNLSPCGVIFDSIFIFLYYVLLVFRYGKKYSVIDKIAQIIKILLSVFLIFVFSFRSAYLRNDEFAHSIATCTILFTCILPIVILMFFYFRNKIIIRKASQVIAQISCIIDALEIIENNPDTSVFDKVKMIINKANQERDDNRQKYFIRLSLKLAYDSVQYVSKKDNSNHIVNSPTDEEVSSLTLFNDNNNNNRILIRIYEKILKILLKKHDNNKGVRIAKKIQNNSQLAIEKNKVFDKKLWKILLKISKYGIPISHDSNEKTNSHN